MAGAKLFFLDHAFGARCAPQGAHIFAFLVGDDDDALHPGAAHAAMTWPSMGRPATACMTLGIADFIRVPCPAAKMIPARVMLVR